MISIVIPTYNERENIAPILEEIDSNFEGPGDYEVLIVDDDSPDGTWRKAEEVDERFPVRVIRRKGERGLSTAVLRGFKEARADTIVVMDADFQHPPSKVPALLSEIDGGADIAIGSRHVKGGGTGDFGFFRSLISKGADFLARTLFRRTRNVKDIQSGFFALRKEVLKGAELDPRGYKVLLEILVQGDYDRISEVGYKFGSRSAGESKLGITSIMDYLRHLWSLSRRSGELSRFFKFCAAGGLGTLVNLSFTYGLTSFLDLFWFLSGVIGIEMGLLSNFFVNKVWAFGDRRVKGKFIVLKALVKDHMVRSLGIALNLIVLWSLTSVLGLYYLISQVIGIGVATVWNYGGNKWWTWEG